jgi:hypothetical protein
MNNKTSPPSTNLIKKCRALFPYFPGLESRLAGEHTVRKVENVLIWFMPMSLHLEQTDRRPRYFNVYDHNPDKNAFGNWDLLRLFMLQPVESTRTNFRCALTRWSGAAETRNQGITRTWWVVRQQDKVLVKDDGVCESEGQVPVEMSLSRHKVIIGKTNTNAESFVCLLLFHFTTDTE